MGAAAACPAAVPAAASRHVPPAAAATPFERATIPGTAAPAGSGTPPTVVPAAGIPAADAAAAAPLACL